MGLIGNYTVLNKNPGRSFGGSTVSETRSECGKNGALRGAWVSSQGFHSQAAIPNGYLPPYAFALPIKGGGLATYTIITGTGTVASGNLFASKNLESTLAGTGTIATAPLGLVVSMLATLAGEGLIDSAALVGQLNMAATVAGTGSLSAAILAIGNMVATLAGTGGTTPTLTAYATLEAEILPYTDLSPQALAAAVWSSTVSTLTTDDTTGYALRVLHALGRNRVVTNPSTGTFTVYDDDNTVLLSGDLWEDAAATTAYSGSGAERRDRLT